MPACCVHSPPAVSSGDGRASVLRARSRGLSIKRWQEARDTACSLEAASCSGLGCAELGDGSATCSLVAPERHVLLPPFPGVGQISDIQVSGQSEDMTAKEKLLLWSQRMVEGYQGLRCDNFTTSWRDGRLFNAIIHHHKYVPWGPSTGVG